MRTLIYARYSSQLQNPRSVADQIAACRARADAEGWTIVGEYDDAAISGAAGIGAGQRPGLHAMLARVEAGGIDRVLTESTDRIARHQGDAFAVRERIEFAGARLFTLLDGEVDDITGTIKGLFDSRMRKDLAHRVRRGQLGNITAGRSAGGVAFGYRRVISLDARGEPIRGLREIDPDKAAIVLRIFREYAAGASPASIAKRLNAEGVAPCRRGIWRASTLIGDRSIGFGILSNPIYAGRLVYGRTKQIVDPRTRERRMRPADAPVEGDAAHLRIVDETLWVAVQAQLGQRAVTRPEKQRRPKHILSGLGHCGVCGAGWVMVRGNYAGCSYHDAGGPGACTNNRLIARDQYEQRVLAELKEQMLAPDVVAEYLREYHREHARQTGALTRDRDQAVRRLDEAQRKVDRLVRMIAEGAGEFSEFREALAAARDDRDRLTQQIAGMDALPVLTLHPGLAEQYRRSIEVLHTDLADDAARIEAVPKLRKLIARIILTPAEGPRGVDIKIIRQIDEVLNLAQEAPRRNQLR